jgi:DNA-binding transcriptional LysR family regulator
MIAVPGGPEMRMAVVGAMSYFKRRPEPRTPRDLIQHNCTNLRLPDGGVYARELEKGAREMRVHVTGQLTCNTDAQELQGALAGAGSGVCARRRGAAPYGQEPRKPTPVDVC